MPRLRPRILSRNKVSEENEDPLDPDWKPGPRPRRKPKSKYVIVKKKKPVNRDPSPEERDNEPVFAAQPPFTAREENDNDDLDWVHSPSRGVDSRFSMPQTQPRSSTPEEEEESISEEEEEFISEEDHVTPGSPISPRSYAAVVATPAPFSVVVTTPRSDSAVVATPVSYSAAVATPSTPRRLKLIVHPPLATSPETVSNQTPEERDSTFHSASLPSSHYSVARTPAPSSVTEATPSSIPRLKLLVRPPPETSLETMATETPEEHDSTLPSAALPRSDSPAASMPASSSASEATPSPAPRRIRLIVRPPPETSPDTMATETPKEHDSTLPSAALPRPRSESSVASTPATSSATEATPSSTPRRLRLIVHPPRGNPPETTETTASRDKSTDTESTDTITDGRGYHLGGVIDYLAKKGYGRTEASLRMESANQELDSRPLPPLGEDARPKFKQGFDILKTWVEENLDIYKPELRRVLWPLFVYSFINMVTSGYQPDAKQFFESNKNMFLPEHSDDIRVFEPISIPEHVQHNEVANKYRNNKWRIILSDQAYSVLLLFLESKEKEGGSVMTALLSSYCTIRTVARSADDRFSFAAMMGQAAATDTFPMEDEGIPGHHPGSAYTGDNPAMAGALTRLRLGKLPMEQFAEEDVRAELAEEDAKAPPPVTGRNTLVQEFEQMIKTEEDEEAPSRADLPFPRSTARDVAMEVIKVKENRDRFKIEGHTGGVGPGISICMFTFHNTQDAMNCIDFSDDNELVAGGFNESYIRVWNLEGKNIEAAFPSLDKQTPSNSRRLFGHQGPVYAVHFQPSATRPEPSERTGEDYVPTNSRFLLSSSADKTVRLWSLDTWSCVVVYKGHANSAWDVRWGPFGHYFVSGSGDNSGRIWMTSQHRQMRILVGHENDVDCVCFHPNSAYVFTASCDHTVRMWAVSTGNSVRIFTGHAGNITAMECSRNGKTLASADDQGDILLWDLASGRLLKRMRGHGKGGVWSLSWSMESTVLVSGGADGTVRVWDPTGPQDSNQGRVLGDGSGSTKIDAGNPATGATGQTKKKKGKEDVVTPDQISAFPTKKSPVYKVKFTRMNLVVAGGAYLP